MRHYREVMMWFRRRKQERREAEERHLAWLNELKQGPKLCRKAAD
jgi:uncharacterized protein YciI